MSNQNDFNNGIEFVVNFLKQELLSGSQPVVTKNFIEKTLNNIPKKCNFCTKPCGNSWCSTAKEEE